MIYNDVNSVVLFLTKSVICILEKSNGITIIKYNILEWNMWRIICTKSILYKQESVWTNVKLWDSNWFEYVELYITVYILYRVS